MMAQSMSNTQERKNMFEDPKWKPIYIKRQRTNKNKEKEQMTFNNKQELIDKIKEKEESAKIAYEQTFNMQPCYETKEKQVKNKAYMEAYADVMALIDSAKIVVYPEETGKMPCKSAPKQDIKVKIIKSAYYSEIENDITDFIKDKAIIDIKFTAGTDYGSLIYFAMILYKEDKSE